MIQDLEAGCRDYKDKHWLSKLCGRIDLVATSWAPFFTVVGTFVQSNPEYAALAWGAIRLVFLVSLQVPSPRGEGRSHRRAC